MSLWIVRDGELKLLCGSMEQGYHFFLKEFFEHLVYCSCFLSCAFGVSALLHLFQFEYPFKQCAFVIVEGCCESLFGVLRWLFVWWICWTLSLDGMMLEWDTGTSKFFWCMFLFPVHWNALTSSGTELVYHFCGRQSLSIACIFVAFMVVWFVSCVLP